jgi:NAD(P)-dependent dehydrogenase (short-subunit alcohol dehydrogenase family)
VYLIIGGLGGIGLAVAEALSTSSSAHFVLLSRQQLPAQEDWAAWLAAYQPGDAHYALIQSLLTWQQAGARVSVAKADVSSYDSMQSAVAAIRAAYGLCPACNNNALAKNNK